ncbi:hypothetical protein HVX64_23485 (plasmid) [Citrobacter sp. RHB20-C16]|uniref:Uncharacterized protein n=1 Tax=Citrobacter amalonaticus TaxID=35703 RepID=A0ABY0HV02_CITAM|nr:MULTISPECIES: hypothetical protein [Citrobacter]MZK91440.1 hypothetical protein [Citrobacter amalonaticus]MZK95996.1 hypothetical protein [Citrobacter amalonaticus]MZL05736.1 hypothetical protein [Citrobacter amalonaticus]MZL25765.1 hypothetical protein [Citrobacter amalonaticus]MZL43676.1 hypothetical protein [Citrobacter amalonaticus]
MKKLLKKFLIWFLGLSLAVIAAVLFGKVIGFLGISNSLIVSSLGAIAGMICSTFYRGTVKYIQSEEYRLKIQEYKEKLNENAKKERELLKRKTIVELYLLNEKKTFIKVKFLSLAIIFGGVILSFFLDYSPIVTVIGIGLFAAMGIKEHIVAFRIDKGFFGNNSTEAIQLLKFIEANIDMIDDGGSGRGRKILNDPVLEDNLEVDYGKGAVDVR